VNTNQRSTAPQRVGERLSVHVEQKHDDLDASNDEIGCEVALERDRDAFHAIQHLQEGRRVCCIVLFLSTMVGSARLTGSNELVQLVEAHTVGRQNSACATKLQHTGTQ
jgi:hypothetical protein